MFAFAVALLTRQTTPDLIARVRKAVSLNAAPWLETELLGTGETFGVPTTYRFQFDTKGHFLQQTQGTLGETYGYDGKTFWETDHSGAPRTLAYQDADAQLAEALALSDGWLNPSVPLDITSVGNTVHIKFMKSGFEETIDIDPATNLPSSASFSNDSGLTKISLSAWSPAGSLKVPFKGSITSGGLTDTFTVLDAEPVHKPATKDFEEPIWQPQDLSFDSSKPAEVESKKMFTGHVLVHPLVNGQDVGWFILDSGAGIMVIDPAVADSLKLGKTGRQQLVGVAGSTTSFFRTADSFSLGQATMRKALFAEYDLHQLNQIFGTKVAGIVGYDFFRRTIISVDLQKPKVAVEDPRNYRLTSGSWTPLTFDSANPVVEASFEGDRKALFRLDTGANGGVTFHTPYVISEKLLDGRKTTNGMSGGVGGMSTIKLGHVDWFELGGHRFQNPAVAFSQAKTGAFTNHYLAGNIGQDLMLPFTVVFDFGGSRVAFLQKTP